MTKSHQFALVVQAVASRRFDEARNLLSDISTSEHEPRARELKAALLHAAAEGLHIGAQPHDLSRNQVGETGELRLPSGRPLPRISIVTPSFNQGEYIAETIQSVINQGYPNVEHIIIDGGSTDGTMAVVESFRSALAFVESEKDRGQSHALNKGFARATGDILCWLNSDDQLAPDALFSVALAFDSGEPDLVAGICEVYRDGKLEGRHLTSCRNGPLPIDDLLDLDNNWLSGQFFYQPEVFFTRSLWERAGSLVREDCYYSMDYELWCRFALAGAKLKVIGTPLAWFRSHPAQKTAVAERFQRELREVRTRFINEHGLQVTARDKQPIDWSRRPRVALINDHGPQHGAGIAHARVAAALETGEWEAELFELTRFVIDDQCDTKNLLATLADYRPDAVVWGNVHSVGQAALAAVAAVCERYMTAWIAHDFWLVTGRCAYFGTCNKYLSECDADCPTADEYPKLDRPLIGTSHNAKRGLLRGPHAPALWANSSWTESVLQRATAAIGGSTKLTSRINLGAPSLQFGRKTRVEARHEFGLSDSDFIVLFSATSVSDKRKGVATLLEALRRVDSRRMKVLVLGSSDIAMDSLQHEVLMLGYVTDVMLLSTIFAAADLFVGPSQEETFGQVFVEAALSGTPSIAFDRSGMIDAVVHRTTGLRVPNSAEALAYAIMQIESDSDLRARIGFWAPLWARSNHSLEASYRSMHHAFEDLGLMQKLALPRRITLKGKSGLLSDTESPARGWLAADGVSAPEGPYPPDFPDVIHWCSGPTAKFRIRVPVAGPVCVEIDCMNPLFEHQDVKIQIGDSAIEALCVPHTPPPAQFIIKIKTSFLKAGWCLMTLTMSQSTIPGQQEKRSLALIVKDIRVIADATISGRSTKPTIHSKAGTQRPSMQIRN